ncbi:MAG: sugar-binding protein [Eubacteriales bacterium]|jgi:hypothetical protein|nr:hypothetical protein [Clostridiales bacterium]
MKKKILAVSMTIALAFSLVLGISAQENYSIPMAATPPTIDGDIGADEWNNALTVDVSSDNLGWVLPQIDGMSIGAGSYVKFMWDAEYLYCAASIIDSTYGAQPASGGPLNSGDGVQLCFYTDEGATNGDGFTNMFWDFLPRTGEGDASTAESYEHFNFVATTDLPIKSTVKDNGDYTIEWAIPWTLFAEANSNGYDVLYTGTEGTEIIMMITIMDHDGAGTQALGYSTDEWCVAATTDVYTLTSDLAGVAAAPEPEPAADEVLQSQLDPMSELESELAAAAADAATVAPATADFSIAFAALGAASAALALAKKKRK